MGGGLLNNVAETMTDLDFNLGTYLVDDDEILLNAITQVYELKDMEIAAVKETH